MAGSRNWADLPDGPTALIADRVLAYDVADYVRFRAVCLPWRRCSADPRAHGSLDRRFHPRRWAMLREELAAPNRRSFLNTSTGECVQVDLPELHDHCVLALTSEGLLVLVHHKPQRNTVRLLNPFTGHLTELPPLTTLLSPHDQHMRMDLIGRFKRVLAAWGSGVANDDSTVVLCFNTLDVLGVAKPGDDHWTLLKCQFGSMLSPLMLAGRFYCVNWHNGVMVLETSGDQPPRLEMASELNLSGSLIEGSLHLVNNCGELMLVHRWSGPLSSVNRLGYWYDAYRVDLDKRTLFPVNSLGGAAGRAVFMGMHCSLSVSIQNFPSGSITADTIYLGFDVAERAGFKVGAYHLADGSIEGTGRYEGRLVPRPHTLVDCLCLANTV
ncbi:uncharacterized protein LOC119270255 [Triticum dicoccoides]|uniref:uncharacterized protein LOC119270255 n=1 Tax=Triticum dicoccoides TaxID=85692 RepID=UPI00188E1D1C|nr:uncharacterized protein LOC119270255 [Triticum dicoccoides]XP_037408143.1 uncharacterized protein LOC119270255 [Triticum dicoccoides]XP_037408144.1 uncharacterized protein LOC119270255 [Triticum dicoccoides]XP_037408145.1 uncharacterized protein LOC119270255 [Triticum dicoccoides]